MSLLLDTGGLVTLLDRSQSSHSAFVEFFDGVDDPLLRFGGAREILGARGVIDDIERRFEVGDFNAVAGVPRAQSVEACVSGDFHQPRQQF